MSNGPDAIVIGSGFGGAVTACRLAEAGYRVLVLERGRRWDPGTFPREPGDRWVWDHHHPERASGWLDFRMFRRMAVAQGAAVGGGSHIYANVSIEADPATFEAGWPPEITYEALSPHYRSVGAMMNVQSVPRGQWPPRTALMAEAAEKTGHADRFGPSTSRSRSTRRGRGPHRTPRTPRGRGASSTPRVASRARASISANATSGARSSRATRWTSTTSRAPRRGASTCVR